MSRLFWPSCRTCPGFKERQSISKFAVASYPQGQTNIHQHGLWLQVPNGAYGQFLLGRIARLTSRPDKAVAHFEKALILNPMLWSAYEELCSLGLALLVPPASTHSNLHSMAFPHFDEPHAAFFHKVSSLRALQRPVCFVLRPNLR